MERSWHTAHNQASQCLCQNLRCREDHLQSLEEKVRLVHALDQELRRRDAEARQSIAQLQASQGQLQADSYVQQQQLLAAQKVLANSVADPVQHAFAMPWPGSCHAIPAHAHIAPASDALIGEYVTFKSQL